MVILSFVYWYVKAMSIFKIQFEIIVINVYLIKFNIFEININWDLSTIRRFLTVFFFNPTSQWINKYYTLVEQEQKKGVNIYIKN